MNINKEKILSAQMLIALAKVLCGQAPSTNFTVVDRSPGLFTHYLNPARAAKSSYPSIMQA